MLDLKVYGAEMDECIMAILQAITCSILDELAVALPHPPSMEQPA